MRWCLLLAHMSSNIRPEIFPKECYTWSENAPPSGLIPVFLKDHFSNHSTLSYSEKLESLSHGLQELAKGANSPVFRNLADDHANLSIVERKKFRAILGMWNNFLIEENQRRSINRPHNNLFTFFRPTYNAPPPLFTLDLMQILDIAAAGLKRK